MRWAWLLFVFTACSPPADQVGTECGVLSGATSIPLVYASAGNQRACTSNLVCAKEPASTCGTAEDPCVGVCQVACPCTAPCTCAGGRCVVDAGAGMLPGRCPGK